MPSKTNKDKSFQTIKSELVSDRVMIWDHQDGSRLYSSGYFGKPIGIRKPKGDNFERPLELSLIEACYLIEKGWIEVYIKNEKKPIKFDVLVERGKKKYLIETLHTFLHKQLHLEQNQPYLQFYQQILEQKLKHLLVLP